MIFIDLETTGLEPPPEGQVCEYAIVTDQGHEFTGMCSYDGLVKPGARAAHHIGPEMCLGKPRWRDVLNDKDLIPIRLNNEYAVAHNAPFDSRWFPREMGMRWICSLKLARLIWPDEESYKLQHLRYSRHVNSQPPEGLSAHRALYDTIVLRDFFLQCLLPAFDNDVEKMYLVSSNPVLLKKVGFGSHKGKAWSEVPKSYLRWILDKDFDADIVHTARYHMENG